MIGTVGNIDRGNTNSENEEMDLFYWGTVTINDLCVTICDKPILQLLCIPLVFLMFLCSFMEYFGVLKFYLVFNF